MYIYAYIIFPFMKEKENLKTNEMDMILLSNIKN